MKTLKRLKKSVPVVVPMKNLPRPDAGMGFDKALGFLIFSTAMSLDIDGPSTMARFLVASPLCSSTGAVKALIRERGPLLFVLDDIADLALQQFTPYFATERKPTALHRAMTQLSQSLQRLHAIKDCFIYCTGRSLWLSTQALVGDGSPLLVTPLMLAPLSAGDVRTTLSLTVGRDSTHFLEHEVGVARAMRPYLAERAVRVTGGMGRVLQFLLRALQRHSKEQRKATTCDEVDAALERVRPLLSKVAGIVLRITWDGADSAVGEVPLLLQDVAYQRQLLRLFARALLLDAPFAPAQDVDLGATTRVKFSDAAVVLGFSYAPYLSPPAQAEEVVEDVGGEGSHDGRCAISAAAAQPDELLKLVAGDWLCKSLLTDPRISRDPGLLVAAQFLDTMRSFGGTMSGRPFELLCVDALCVRSLLSPDKCLQQLVAPLGVSGACNEIVPQLTVVAMPKVTRGTPPLDSSVKEPLLRSRGHWTGRPTIHPDDLPWFLTEWLCNGTIAVPADAQSGSQDWFLRLNNAVIGNANKAVGTANGTQWNDVRAELCKAPTLSPPFKYTLVLWSLNLAPELRDALDDVEACQFSSGRWGLNRARLARCNTTESRAKFTMPEQMELILVNPYFPTGGGLAGLIGVPALRSLRALADTSGQPLGVPSLIQWMENTTSSTCAGVL